MTCLDLKTGKPVVDEGERVKAGIASTPHRWPRTATFTLASLEGSITVVQAGEDEPNVVYSVKLPEPIRATPAISENTLFVRSDKFLYAFAEKK